MDACIHIYSDEDDVRERARAHDNARDIYAHDCGQLPFGTLDPRAFELIVRDLFDEKKVEATWDWYDTAFRINDGSEKGLEGEVAVITSPEEMDAQHLYVAMTRGASRLVVCSLTPILAAR
ncbi:hypothetical protein ACPEG9_15810 [Escherichia coli]|uniref:hypothetical protein n=1 Tax=Escherichia coli TaxID=562 RepID=UPI003C2CBC05